MLRSCFHTFCKDCLVRLVEQTRTRNPMSEKKARYSIVCPNCREVTHMPSNDVSALPSGFHVYDFKSFREALVEETNTPTTTNEEGVAKFAMETDEWVKSGPRCVKHNEEVKIYCQTCDVVGCVECVYEHLDHKHQLISKVFEQHKAEIVQYLEPILKQRDIYEKALKPVEARIEEIDA